MIPISLLLKSRRETGHSRATRIKRYGYREGEADESDSPRKFVDFSILKNSRFCLLLVSGIFAISGYLTPFYFIGSYATQHGVDVTTAALMVGLMNGASAFGRIIMGQISDKIGYINSLFLATFTASLSLLVLWMYAKTLAAIAAFSVVYGLCGGAYFATTVSVAASICGIERLAEVTGIIYAAMAIGVSLGSPISGAILDTVKDHNDYTGVILWSGLTMLLGSTLQFGLKYMTDRRVFVRV
ncbi:hypothetical protein EC991_010885 [Linnemannia zychae]|nr:hypothetical protein EC991_010885 [Linnemannia zychae]